MDVPRRKRGEIKIGEVKIIEIFERIIQSWNNSEHLKATDLTLVGLQVWRGALLLADYIFHNRNEFEDKQILELGSGVGLTGGFT